MTRRGTRTYYVSIECPIEKPSEMWLSMRQRRAVRAGGVGRKAVSEHLMYSAFVGSLQTLIILIYRLEGESLNPQRNHTERRKSKEGLRSEPFLAPLGVVWGLQTSAVTNVMTTSGAIIPSLDPDHHLLVINYSLRPFR
ncbi:hypothetical protein EVAR_18303_1 [Eumeta japonica]|uniref:Uncharacterized protein n=1 Tax=Eumeta variegata TaxID=151549 RepID=A0A4C1V8I2_EUMVA|nr:hypothetical protein EVAR_18303_1 [Eumeta japonica]